MLTDINRRNVDEAEVRKFRKDYDYLVLATDLFRESAQWVGIFTNAVVGSSESWNRTQAVIGGHLVRLFKLMRPTIEAAKNRRGEQLWVFLRLASETIINFRFLLRNDDEETIRSYIHQSLQHEVRLLERIEENVTNRGGKALPIEERMRRSVERTFRNSEVTPSSVPSRKIRNWAGKNLYQKAEAIGLDQAYWGMFGGPSRNIHGSWQDLLQHHLTVVRPGVYRPNFEDARTRPQPFFALSKLVIEGLVEYSQYLETQESAEIDAHLSDLLARIELADRLHEEYLGSRSGAA